MSKAVESNARPRGSPPSSAPSPPPKTEQKYRLLELIGNARRKGELNLLDRRTFKKPYKQISIQLTEEWPNDPYSSHRVDDEVAELLEYWRAFVNVEEMFES